MPTLWEIIKGLLGGGDKHLELRYNPKKTEISATTIDNSQGKTINNFTINMGDTKDKQEVVRQIQEVFQKLPEGERILNDGTTDLLSRLYAYNGDRKDDEKVLAFFHDIISKEDLGILEASLFVRYQFQKKNDREYAKSLKSDIYEKFEERGAFLCNLCNAGYFEEFFIPLYNENPKGFREKYDSFTNNYRFAIFINHNMDTTDAFYKIKHHIEAAKRYGIKTLNIHAIGKKNNYLLNSALAEARKLFSKQNITYKRNIIKNYVIVVQLFL